MMSSPAYEVYTKANDALATLSNLWQTMLEMIHAVSLTSASSLTVEPDLVGLQKKRKEYEQLISSLKTTVAWLETNKLEGPSNDAITTDDLERTMTEQEELKKESDRVTDQLKRLLNQSYALQFQMEMLFTSAQDIKLP